MNQLSLLVEMDKSILTPAPKASGNVSAIALNNPINSKQSFNGDFSQIVGQTLAKSLLNSANFLNRIAPAFLFSGVDGIGKTLIARTFAAQLLNTNNLNSHPDLLWVEPTYLHQGALLNQKQLEEAGITRKSPPQLRLEQIQNVTRFLSTSAITGRKVVIISEAERMNVAAANALLKTLEEPKGNNCIILVSSQAHKQLPTISSRCSIIPFYCLNDDQLTAVLEKLARSEILQQPTILAMAAGSPGQAIAYYDMWQSIPSELLSKLEKPPGNILEALQISSSVKSLEPQQQMWLLDYIQFKWWTEYRNEKMVAKVESAKSAMNKSVAPRLVWDVLLLPFDVSNWKHQMAECWCSKKTFNQGTDGECDRHK